METQDELLRFLIDALEELGIDYALVASVASMAYGEPRYTRDIEALAVLTEADVPRLAARFPAPEFYLDPGAAREAIRSCGMFNVIHPTSGFKIVLYPARRREDRERVARARTMPATPDREGRFVAPEEVILAKLDYYRMGESDKHLRDIAAMLQISAEQIDRAYVSREAARLGVGEIWKAVLRRVGVGSRRGGLRSHRPRSQRREAPPRARLAKVLLVRGE